MYIGLTGGIGSGKSTVARFLAEFGAIVIDADEQARAALGSDSPLLPEIEAVFGPGLITDGELNRQALAAKVFADEELRRKLENLVHPEVARRVSAIRATLPPDAVVIYDVPLLVEKQLQSQFDAVIVVQSSLETRLSRLEARGISRSDAIARIEHQASDSDRAVIATYVIENDGDLHDLQRQCETVWEAISA